jgi:hypothetical protein
VSQLAHIDSARYGRGMPGTETVGVVDASYPGRRIRFITLGCPLGRWAISAAPSCPGRLCTASSGRLRLAVSAMSDAVPPRLSDAQERALLIIKRTNVPLAHGVRSDVTLRKLSALDLAQPGTMTDRGVGWYLTVAGERWLEKAEVGDG